MKITKICLICTKEFSVPHWRENAKFCSADCRQESLKAHKNDKCDQCGAMFHIKESQRNRYKRRLGTFCSNLCLGEYKKIAYTGDKNPNYKNKMKDSDGYLIWNKSSISGLGILEKKLHRAVACESIGVIKISGDIHVHHRDCNILNNGVDNLSIMTPSDHKWLHKSFGNSVLWALYNGKIDVDTLCSWSTDPEKSKVLLTRTLSDGYPTNQMAIVDDVLQLIQP